MPDDVTVRPLRDERRPPFCFQTHVALDAIRSTFAGPKTATALAVYLSLTEVANRKGGADTRGHFRAFRAEVAEGAGVSVDTLDRYIPGLVEAGVVAVRRQAVGRANLPNEWSLLDPCPDAPPGRVGAATPGRAGAAPLKNVGKESTADAVEARVVQAAWLAYDQLQRHGTAYFEAPRFQKALRSALKVHPVDDIVRAIENYAEVVESPAHYWSHRWTLVDFLTRGIDRFVDAADPLTNYRSARGPAPTDDVYSGLEDV